MARKIQVRLIMQRRAAGLSQSEIARIHHMSKTSVSEVFRIAQERQISFADLEGRSNEECYRMFFPEKQTQEEVFEQPDYAAVHRELPRTGVTLKLLWKEYRDRCKRQGLLSYGYSRFCNGYSKYVVLQNLTNRLEHKPGTTSQVDWSGSTMHLTDPATGEMRKVYLFVATLPYSQYTYVEPCLEMKENSWLLCHVHMFEFWGGTTTRIVCDNLKTGVVKHPKEGEIVLNEAYEALGNHYMTAIWTASSFWSCPTVSSFLMPEISSFEALLVLAKAIWPVHWAERPAKKASVPATSVSLTSSWSGRKLRHSSMVFPSC